MNSEGVGIEEARKVLGDLVNRVTYTGASITLTRNGRPVARLAPLEPAMTYTHRIDTTTDGEIWQPERLADAPEEYTGSAAEYGRAVLEQWLVDEHDGEMPVDDDGTPLRRVVVYQVRDGAADETPAAVVDLISPQSPVVWSVVRGEAPNARLVDPGPAGITIPDDVLTWAASHGHDPADPDVWIAVAAADDAGPVPNEIAYRDGTIPTAEADNLRD